MKVQLNDTYRIRTDSSYNFLLESLVKGKKGTKTEGKTSWKIIGHYCHLGHALDSALQNKLIVSTGNGATDVIQVLNEFLEIAKRLDDKHLAANMYRRKGDPE
jgi:hypothetical protein